MKIRWNMKELSKIVTSRKYKKTESKNCIIIGKIMREIKFIEHV
jgi:hypothetical protein